MRENGNRGVYFATFKRGKDLFKREEIESTCDQVVGSHRRRGGDRSGSSTGTLLPLPATPRPRSVPTRRSNDRPAGERPGEIRNEKNPWTAPPYGQATEVVRSVPPVR